MSLIYLDNNATTRVLPQVAEAMQPWLYTLFGNPSSSHSVGQQAKEALMAARANVAKFIGASPAEIVFTSGATESNHTAILHAIASLPARKTIITSSVEHSGTLQLLDSLSQQGFRIITIPVLATGELNMSALKAAIDHDTALVTIMHANNETGVLFPIAEIAALAHDKGALFHTDAAQSIGKISIHTPQLGCDMLSFSGHKLHAPKGIGVLFVRKGIALTPLFQGHQERKRRGGTENMLGIIGLGAACQQLMQSIDASTERMAHLRNHLQRSLLAHLPFARLNGTGLRVPNTCNITFSGIAAEALLHKLDKNGVIASQGSACVAGGTDPSHVLLAMGLTREEALSSVRFSLSKETTEADIETAITSIVAVVNEINAQTHAFSQPALVSMSA